MKSALRKVYVMTFLILVFVVQASAVQDGKVEKTFRGVDEIRIKTVSGNCIVEKGQRDQVRVVLTYTYDDYDFEPEFEQRGDRLLLNERFTWRRNSRGTSTWRLTVPEKTAIDFSTASGDFEAADLNSSIEASTASGDVDIRSTTGEFQVSTASGNIQADDLQGLIKASTASGDVRLSRFAGETKISTASGGVRSSNLDGEIKLSTASGNIILSRSSGTFEVSTASGDVEADDIVLKAGSSFSAASGDVEVSLGESSSYDLEVSSASGNALLNFNGNRIRGFIKMTAKARRGRISAPFNFDDEEYYWKWDDEYVTKTVRKGSDNPRIDISTASGKASLVER